MAAKVCGKSWKERGRIDSRRKSSVLGRPPKHPTLTAEQRAERKRELVRQWRNSPARVLEAWRWECFTRSKAAILVEAAEHAYGDWFDSLDADHDSSE